MNCRETSCGCCMRAAMRLCCRRVGKVGVCPLSTPWLWVSVWVMWLSRSAHKFRVSHDARCTFWNVPHSCDLMLFGWGDFPKLHIAFVFLMMRSVREEATSLIVTQASSRPGVWLSAFFNFLFIPLNLCVGWNLKLPTLKCASPIWVTDYAKRDIVYNEYQKQNAALISRVSKAHCPCANRFQFIIVGDGVCQKGHCTMIIKFWMPLYAKLITHAFATLAPPYGW